MRQGPYDHFEPNDPMDQPWSSTVLTHPAFAIGFGALEITNMIKNNPFAIVQSADRHNRRHRMTRHGMKPYPHAGDHWYSNKTGSNRGRLVDDIKEFDRANKGTGQFNRRTARRYMNASNAAKAKAGFDPSKFGARYGNNVATRMSVGRAMTGMSRAYMMWGMIEIGVMGADMVLGAILGNDDAEKNTWNRRNLETGGGFVDTRSAQTQRARAVQAIHNTQMSTRAVFGYEAAHLHGGPR